MADQTLGKMKVPAILPQKLFQGIGRGLCIIALAATIYVLSNGPAVYLWRRKVISSEVMNLIYRPATPLWEFTIFREYLDWW